MTDATSIDPTQMLSGVLSDPTAMLRDPAAVLFGLEAEFRVGAFEGKASCYVVMNLSPNGVVYSPPGPKPAGVQLTEAYDSGSWVTQARFDPLLAKSLRHSSCARRVTSDECQAR